MVHAATPASMKLIFVAIPIQALIAHSAPTNPFVYTPVIHLESHIVPPIEQPIRYYEEPKLSTLAPEFQFLLSF